MGSRTGERTASSNDQIRLKELNALTKRMYTEARERTRDPKWNAVIDPKITIMFGPPMVKPDLVLVSFQGGAGDRSPTKWEWPDKLVYLDSRFAFGRNLTKLFNEAGHASMLKYRTTAITTCFPEARANDASKWIRKTGAYALWRNFSSNWARRMLRAMQPRSIIVFGKKASQSLGLEGCWSDVKRNGNGQWYGHTEIEGCPAVYCHHLSQGYKKSQVHYCLRAVESIVKPAKQ